MPNWCYNRITVYADEDTADKLEELKEIFENPQPFNTLFPHPDWKNTPNSKGELPKLRRELNKDGSVFYETYDFPDGKNDDRWYHWCIDNWGTKWEPDIASVDGDQDSEMLEITFNTAWSPPQGVVEAMRTKYPKLTFQCFYDEPGCEIAGYY